MISRRVETDLAKKMDSNYFRHTGNGPDTHAEATMMDEPINPMDAIRTPDHGTLALTRKPGESIVIGEDIVVQVVWSRRDEVRVLVMAPKSVLVHRDEVWSRRQRALEFPPDPGAHAACDEGGIEEED